MDNNIYIDTITDPAIYTVVEQMPEFPGGNKELFRFIHKNLKYPIFSEEDGINDTAVVRFVVTDTGEITDIEAVKGGSLCDSLISTIKKMPHWIPGRHEGKQVNTYFTLPMHVNLKK